MKYRAEIDGLRALAVVPVILFHAGFELFSGGFVGVDIFFVISGYLITTILIEDIEKQRFSLVNFYERRARRILPALFFVMFVCIPFAWMWMLPTQMKNFSQSLVAVSLFASNVLFWRKSGYFDAAAEEKPLLHTWSLAVEEQYYVVFPIFLFLAWRYGKNRVFWTIVVLAAISLTLSEWGWRNKAIANFYLAPTRAWELLAGSIAAFIVLKRGVQSNNILSLIGLALIVFSIFAYDETTPFPSVYALVPVVGAMLLVLYADGKTFVARLLSTRAFVGIGLISYSAYLWHQPLFAFARIRMLDDPSLTVMTILTIATISLAYLSWKYIEKPFRSKESVTGRRVIIISIIGVLFFSVVGLTGHNKSGFIKSGSLPSYASINTDIYVIGDSHAAHLISGFKEVTRGKVANFTSPGCIPFRNVDRYDYRFEVGACAKTMNGFLDEILGTTEDAVVVLSTMGPVYLDGTTFMDKDPDRVKGLGVELITDDTVTNRYSVFEIGMRSTLTELTNNSNLTVVFTIDVPELGIDNGCGAEAKVIQIFGYHLSDVTQQTIVNSNSCVVGRDQYDKRATAYKILINKVVKDFPNVYLFDPTEYFCNDSVCAGYIDGMGYLYKDIDHLSVIGSNFYANKFADWYMRIIH